MDGESSFSFKNNLSEMFTTNGRGNVLWKPDVLAKENSEVWWNGGLVTETLKNNILAMTVLTL